MAKKIEIEMVRALKTGRSWSKDNTRVDGRYRQRGTCLANVSLHGNLIATMHFKDMDTEFPTVMSITLAGWPTRTTVSRLNYLLNAFCMRDVRINIKGGEAILHNGERDFTMNPCARTAIICN